MAELSIGEAERTKDVGAGRAYEMRERITSDEDIDRFLDEQYELMNEQHEMDARSPRYKTKEECIQIKKEIYLPVGHRARPK